MIYRCHSFVGILKTAIFLCCMLYLGIIGSCLYDPAVLCTAEFVHGLHIKIRDANTGDPIGKDATIIVRDGEYEETPEIISRPDEVIAYAAGERPGVYDIFVSLAGYKPWHTIGIRVLADECHVIPVEVIVELEME